MDSTEPKPLPINHIRTIYGEVKQIDNFFHFPAKKPTGPKLFDTALPFDALVVCLFVVMFYFFFSSPK